MTGYRYDFDRATAFEALLPHVAGSTTPPLDPERLRRTPDPTLSRTAPDLQAARIAEPDQTYWTARRRLEQALDRAGSLTRALDNVEYWDTTDDSEQAAIGMADDVRALVALVQELDPLIALAVTAGQTMVSDDDEADEAAEG